MKNSQDKFNKRLDTTEEKVSELEEIAKETVQTETHKGKKEDEKSFRLMGQIKWSNEYEMGDSEKGQEKIYLKKQRPKFPQI